MSGIATWYGKPYIGRTMKNGEVYTGRELTAAVPWQVWGRWGGKRLLVCDREGCIVVKVTDTCRCREVPGGVILDLSVEAFSRLAPLEQGVIDVRVWEW